MVVLVRYGELALKSPYVRRQLQDRLVTNVQDMFAANEVECLVRSERGRVYVHADDEASAARLLRRVFGVVSVSPAKEATSDLETLARDVVTYAEDVLRACKTFAIRTRRSGEHPYSSMELARVLGRAVQDAMPGLAVDLDAPDGEVHVEVRGPRAYVFHEVLRGPGGLPLGSQGDVLAPVEDDGGMVAAWLMMRRGCRVIVAGSGEPVEALRAWDPHLATLESTPWNGLVLLAEEKRVAGIVSPAQRPEEARAELLVVQPLVGLSQPEIAELARSIRAT